MHQKACSKRGRENLFERMRPLPPTAQHQADGAKACYASKEKATIMTIAAPMIDPPLQRRRTQRCARSSVTPRAAAHNQRRTRCRYAAYSGPNFAASVRSSGTICKRVM